MQQGVGIENGVLINSVSDQFQAHVSQIQEAIKEIPQQGKMRQMAIDSLMQSVATKSSGDPGNIVTDSSSDVYSSLNTVVSLLHDLLNGFQTQIEVEVQELNTKTATLNACNVAGMENEDGGGISGEVETTRSTHVTCRTEEFTARTNVHNSCDTLINRIINFVGSGACDGSAGNRFCDCQDVSDTLPDTAEKITAQVIQSEIDQVYGDYGVPEYTPSSATKVHIEYQASSWNTYQTTMASFWQTEDNYWDANALGCYNHVNTWRAKVITCDTAQTAHYTKFCEHIQARRTRCNNLDTCYLNADNEFNALKTEIETADHNRIEIAKAVQRVICLVGSLQTAKTAGALPDWSANTASDDCRTEVTNNNTNIEGAMQRVPKPVPDAKVACVDVARPWPEDGETQGSFYDTYYSEVSTTDGTAWAASLGSYSWSTYDLGLDVPGRATCDPAR